jgi:hypothetical protein
MIIAALAALAASAAPLRGQARTPPASPLFAVSLSDLTFGIVLPGIPTSVNVFDHEHAALFELQGVADIPVRVELVLPVALVSHDGGHFLPINFGPGDGFADFSRGKPPRGIAFDPHAPLNSALGPNGRLWVRLGGTVTPGRPQRGGAYSATIYLTVYDLST